jgi:hypothetical protein
MPTGYTADVADGKTTDFPTFALQCARAMGACITMRDDPSDAPIPDEFTPSQYNNERLEETLAELHKLESATPYELGAMCNADYQRAHALWLEQWNRREEQRGRYEDMLQRVHQWEPPSNEHYKFKSFMLDQLRESIRFDCSHEYYDQPKLETVSSWLAKRITSLQDKADYHKKAQAEENERTAKRNEWVRQLRESLKPAHVQ